MATAAILRGTNPFLHERGTWNPREDRLPSAVWLAILWIGMIAGFSLDAKSFAHQMPPPPTVLWVHAAVFSGWMLLLTAQVMLVIGDRVAWHRRLGTFMVAWACLMAVLGPWAVLAEDSTHMGSRATPHRPEFMAVNLVDIVGFLILLAWGIALRRNPAAHKRIMILATVSLADPGYARITGHLLAAQHSVVPWFFNVFYGNVLIILLMLAWDAFRGRVMRQFVVGAAGLLAAEFVAAILFFSKPWHDVTSQLVLAWARHFS
ncbi:MAG TPA: hypothetical protein VMT38_02015 [Terracidiphilus sp.]|nr:hypothetical protein [Terracidiphilus sp.]